MKGFFCPVICAFLHVPANRWVLYVILSLERADIPCGGVAVNLIYSNGKQTGNYGINYMLVYPPFGAGAVKLSLLNINFVTV